MIIKNKTMEMELERHMTHDVLITSYYDGKKLGEKIYHLKSGDEISVKMTRPTIDVNML